METCTLRPRTQRKEEREISKGTGSRDTKGLARRYRHHRRKNDALPALRQTERTEGKREEKHTEPTKTAHVDIRGRYAGSKEH